MWEFNEAVHQLFMDLKQAYASVRRAVLQDNITESRVPMKLDRLIKMTSNDTDNKARTGKHFS